MFNFGSWEAIVVADHQRLCAEADASWPLNLHTRRLVGFLWPVRRRSARDFRMVGDGLPPCEGQGRAFWTAAYPFTCPFRKFDPTWIRVVRQNHRMIGPDACDPQGGLRSIGACVTLSDG
jgi:hypothetical protein